jgi:hypothetical protein
VDESNVNIVEMLLNSLQAAEYTDTLLKFLLAKDDERKTAWFIAKKRGNVQLLEKLWFWAKEELTKEDIKNEFLLGTDSDGNAACHLAGKEHNLEILRKVWEWNEGKPTTEEINNKFLLGTGNN